MKVNYCQKCHDCKRIKNISIVEKELNDILGEQQIATRCVSYCGPGREKHFILIDDEIIDATSYEELLNILKEDYGN